MKIIRFPLIERYYTRTHASQARQLSHLEQHTSSSHRGFLHETPLVQEAVTRSYALHDQAYHGTWKYYLTTSALTMVSYLQPTPGTCTALVRLPDTPIWMEAEYPVLAPHLSASGVFFWNPMHQACAGTWILTVVDGQGQPFLNFAYSQQRKRWSFSSLHTCPFQRCTISAIQGSHLFAEPQIIPCRRCVEALDHWQSWFAIALLAVQGAFAQTVDDKPLEVRVVGTTATQTKEGATGKTRYEEPIEHTYHVITFDACLKRPRTFRPPSTEREGMPEKSWVKEALTLNPTSLLYVKRSFLAGSRELDPARCPRWKTRRTVPVRAYEKRVPMLLERAKWQFTQVIASEYQ